MAWASKSQIITSQSVTGTEVFSSGVTLTPGNTVHAEVQGNSNGTTDNLTVNVYGTLDASTENWDDFPIFSFEIDCTSGNDSKVSFIVKDVYKFIIGVIRSGSTDTITTDAWYRENGVDL